MDSKRREILLELSRGLLARAADEAGKRAKYAQRKGQAGSPAAEGITKTRQANRFRKEVERRDKVADNARRDSLDRELDRNRTQYDHDKQTKQKLDQKSFKKYNTNQERAESKREAQFKKGSVMRGIKRLVRKFSPAEKARREKRYRGASQDLTPKRGAVRQDYENNPGQFDKKS